MFAVSIEGYDHRGKTPYEIHLIQRINVRNQDGDIDRDKSKVELLKLESCTLNHF